MPNASKYIIDVANIKPGGNGIKGLWVGDSESKYAMLGNTCIYDKVLYELEVDDITELEPDVTSVTFTKKVSKKTHGNGDINELTITPTSGTIPINSGASEQTTTFTVYNCTGSTATGANVTVSVKQKADYVTGSTYIITGTPDSSTNFPSGGGSHTFTVSSKRRDYYKSGKQVDVSVQFKVKNINENLTLKHNGTVITTATTLSDTNVITASVGDNYHNWQTRTLGFDIYCIDSPTTTYNVSWVQDNDGYSYSRTVTSTSVSSNSIGVNGGTVTLTFGITNYIYYKWASDGTEFLQSYNNDGTATISSSDSSNCSVSPTTVSNGSSITCTVTDNKHSTSTRSFTISASVGGGSGTVSQSADSYSYRRTDVQTEWSTTDSSHIPTGGGSRTASWRTTRYHYYYWDSDDTYYTTTTDNEGTATLTATNGTLNRSTITNGQSVTITAGSSSSERTVSIYENIGGRTISWTQDAPSPKPTPRIISYDISFTSYDPPTPTDPTITIYYTGNIGSATQLWFGIATANTTSAIVASGYTVGNDIEEICSYTLPSTGTPIYLFYKTNTSTTINMGIADGGGSAMNYQVWLGTTGSQTRPISVRTSWYSNGVSVTGWQYGMHHSCTIYGVA